MVDLVYELLTEKGEPMLFRDLMKGVAEKKAFTEEEIDHYLAQLYTDLNIDGRFVCVGRSTWGLRAWYTLEQTTDSAIAENIKDDELDDEFEEELYEEESELDDLDESNEEDSDYVDDEDDTAGHFENELEDDDY